MSTPSGLSRDRRRAPGRLDCARALCRLAEAANELGVQVLEAEVLAENRQMIRVLRDCGYPVKVHSFPGVELVEL